VPQEALRVVEERPSQLDLRRLVVRNATDAVVAEQEDRRIGYPSSASVGLPLPFSPMRKM
jgi:hypothetical protein